MGEHKGEHKGESKGECRVDKQRPNHPNTHSYSDLRNRRSKRRGREKESSREEHVRRVLNELCSLAHLIAREQGLSREETESLDHFVVPITVHLHEEGREALPSAQSESRRLLKTIEAQIESLQRASIAFRAGHVFCFLSRQPDSPDSQPPNPEDTFAGYSPGGRPEWVSFTNLCLQRGEERIDCLYRSRPEVIATILWGDELMGNLLVPWSQDGLSYRILGQVSAGLIPRSLDVRDLSSGRIALTVQVVEIRYGEAPMRLRVNLLGLNREEILEAAMRGNERGSAERLRRLLRNGDQRLRAIARGVNPIERAGKEVDFVEKIAPFLRRLRGDMERCFRPEQQRTQHAQRRHEGNKRPTKDARRDAQSARDDQILEEPRRSTIIVLGPRRRAHVFASNGRLVTSLRLEPGELERKMEQKRWRPIPKELLRDFRRVMERRED